MCFSPQADLIGGTVVAVIGIDALRHVQFRRDLPIASLPLILGAHQLVETFVWWGLQGDVPTEVGRVATALNRMLDENEVATLVDAFGPGRLSLIGAPGMPPASRLQQQGVARLSFGPYPQRVALTALQELVEAVEDGVPPGTRTLT